MTSCASAASRRRGSVRWECRDGHERFGERLAALELGRCARRTEDALAAIAKAIDEAAIERQLGTDHREVERFAIGERAQLVHVTRVDGNRRASDAMPAFPGTQTTEIPVPRASVRTSACSRPPDPMTRSFMRRLDVPQNQPLFRFRTISVTCLESIGYGRRAECLNVGHSSSAFLPKRDESCDSLTHSVELFGPYRGHRCERASVEGLIAGSCS